MGEADFLKGGQNSPTASFQVGQNLLHMRHGIVRAVGVQRRIDFEKAGPILAGRMNKMEFRILNVISALLVIFMLGQFWFARSNNHLATELARDQAQISTGQQAWQALEQLKARIAKGSDTDPRLKEILLRHGLQVTLEVDGKKKTYP
jgi:hypothetical protein